MRLPFSLFLALKYLKPKRSFVSVVTVISVVGVVLGVAILVIVLSVMTGFDNMWRDKILSFKPHLTIYSLSGLVREEDEVARRIEAVEGITGAAPAIQLLTLVQHNNWIDAPYILGVSPERADRVSRVREYTHIGTFSVEGTDAVLGIDLAARLNLRPGDTFLVHSPMNVLTEDEIHLPEELTVAGIFDMGMGRFDSGFVLTSLDVARDLSGYEEGAQVIYVMTEDPFRVELNVERVREQLGRGYDIRSWRDEDRLLFDALTHEKALMFALLVFITIVAFFCVANTLIVITVQKTNEIGLLKALGFRGSRIMAIFVWHGLIQGIVGTFLGLGLGVLVAHNLNEIAHGLTAVIGLFSDSNAALFPKGIYGLDAIPSDVTAGDLRQIFVAVMILCALASILASLRAVRLSPVEAIRHD